MASESKKRLALAVIDFLNASTTDGTLDASDAESIEVATQCIADAFKVDPTDKDAMTDALGGQSLQAIYGVFEKMKKASPAASKPAASKPASSGPSDADKAAAETLKAKGNAAMSQKNFQEAIDYYTQALEKTPNNPIYLSNRAAAHSSLQEFDAAIADAQIAVDTDPSYTKAWSRLGLARFAKGDARGAMEAYKAGIDAEGNGGSDIMRRGYETAKKRVEEEDGAEAAAAASPRAASPRGAGGPGGPGAGGMPDLSSLASMFGGGGAPGGGAGGMPDLGAMMNNPMFAQMAENLMSNPNMLSNLMNNPRLRQMMDSVGGGGGAGEDGADRGGGGGGGGMPDLGSLMQDPSIAEMARNLMGGRGGGAPGGGA